MSSNDAYRMRQVKKLLLPSIVNDIELVAISDTDWMAQAVLADGTGRRFRCVHGKIHDELTIGDARI